MSVNRNRSRIVYGIPILALLLAMLTPPAFARPETFLESDDYSDGDEVVGKMLVDDDYRKMVEDFEFRGVEFDWAWAKARGKKPQKPEALEFETRSYRKIWIAPVTNPSMKIAPRLTEDVAAVFVEAMTQLGLEVVSVEQDADLELHVAIVDYKADKTYAYVAMIDPFIELEIRLRDRRASEDLLVIRHQDHNSTPVLGAADTASDLARLLQ
jgi:hypothetical protein